LEKLGFPWILSCETRLINRLRGYFLIFFPDPFVVVKAAVETARPRFGMAKGRIAHRASLTQFLIFCKTLPTVALAPGLAIQKQLALGAKPPAALPSRDQRLIIKPLAASGGS
jgi:hypothetical protein